MLYTVNRYNSRHVFTTSNGMLLHNGSSTGIAATDATMKAVVQQNHSKLMPIVRTETTALDKLVDWFKTNHKEIAENSYLSVHTPTKTWYHLALHQKNEISIRILNVIEFSDYQLDVLYEKSVGVRKVIDKLRSKLPSE